MFIISGVRNLRNLFGLSAALAILVAAPAYAGEDAQGASVAAESASLDIRKGENIVDADGKRIGKVYQVNTAGDPQVIANMRLVTVPAASLSRVEGKLVSSLSRKEIN